MARLITTAERMTRARALIQQARDLPVPPGADRFDFSYVAQIKVILQQARDLIKFIPNMPSVSPEIKAEVNQIFQEADQANKEIFH